MEDMLKEDMRKLKYGTKTRDTASFHSMQIIKEIAETALASSIDSKKFQDEKNRLLILKPRRN